MKPTILIVDDEPGVRTSLSGVLPNPGNITLHNYAEINAAIGLGKAIINSGIFTGGVLLATLVFGILAGYALARLSFRGRGVSCCDSHKIVYGTMRELLP